jgi:hypothetical protein
MSFLTRTTFYELAALTDELDLDDQIVFSTEDPEELASYNLRPCHFNLICKTKLLWESDYTIVIGLIDGHCTVAKDIYILSNGQIDDEDSRIDGIEEFIKEYYEKYLEKNKHGYVYLVQGIQ